jgi:hypothetical protein
LAQGKSWCVPFNISPSWFSWTLLMVYSKAKLKSNGDKVSLCFRPFWMINLLDRFLPIWTLLLCQIIRSDPRLCVVFHNKYWVLWGRVVSPSPNPQSGGPPTVGCPRLLIQYIRSYPPYLERCFLSATRGRAMPWWQWTYSTWLELSYRSKNYGVEVTFNLMTSPLSLTNLIGSNMQRDRCTNRKEIS